MDVIKNNTLISYAKNSEDIILYRALSDIEHGCYIDVGANDPHIDSVTQLFYERGWRGINIEPVQFYFDKLQSHRMWETNLQIAAGAEEGNLEFFEVEGTGLSTADKTTASLHETQGRVIHHRHVPMRTLTSVCEEYPHENIHFLKIDVEGAEKAVLEGLDMTRHRPWIILLEAIDPITQEPNHTPWEPILIANGYTFVHFDGLNRFYLAIEHSDRTHFFNAPANILDHYMRYDESIRLAHVKELKVHIQSQEVMIKKLHSQLQRAKNDFKTAQEAYSNLSSNYTLLPYPLRILGKIRKRITDIPWMIARLKSFLSRFPWLKKYLLVLRNDYLLRLSASESISPWYETVCSDKVQIASCNPSAKRLIYISPLPPVHSGIADYSMRLLSALAEHYELVVVVENTSEVDPLTCRATLMSAAQYRESGFPLDPHIYHFGNSHHHLWMLPLLERFGGIVMLHDLFLGGLYHSLARQNHIPIEKLLFDNHGYEALIYYDKHGLHETLLQYPMNRNLLAYADAIVVHSEFSYTRLDTPCRYKVPFPKELPILSMSRFEAKKACGFSDSDFVICTFGFIGSSKCAKELLLAWRESMLSTDISAHLVFVGELPQNEYADQLLSLAVALPNPSQVVFTGYVDSKQYAQYMMASDVVVQLRKDSRGETSAAAFDALSYGRALLVNANATLAELPSDVLVRIPDRFIVSDLSIALEEMRRSGTLREKIEKSARQYVQMYHNPALVAQRYRDVIDEAHQKGLFAPYRKALCIDADTSTLIRLRTPFTPPTIFVDISDVAHHDLRTGIQRVVRSILKYLMTSDAPYRISPVRMVEGSYCHAHRFMWKWLGFSTHSIEESPAMMREGDVFLGLDLYVGHIAQNPPLFRRMKEQGVAIHFIVYDILPLRFPHFFPPETHPQFLGWLKLIAEVSTSLCCISRSVADEVRDWLDAHPVSRADVLRIESFPLGADIESSTPSVGITEEQHAMLEAITSGQIVLMVGTIEPRKGHAQAIEAFERLWEQGSESALVIVGKGGWMMDDVLGTLRFHSERNRRLFWFEGASDELLNTLYRRSSLLLAASYGEGFGLPLIEASRHAIPLLVRDIPVFREVASDYATYFHAYTSDELASALREWFEQPCEAGVPLLFTTWEQSAQTLLERIFEEG